MCKKAIACRMIAQYPSSSSQMTWKGLMTCHVNWAAGGEREGWITPSLNTGFLFCFLKCAPGYIIHTINLLIIFYRIVIWGMPIYTLPIVMPCIHSLPAGHRMTIITIKWMRKKKQRMCFSEIKPQHKDLGFYFMCKNMALVWQMSLETRFRSIAKKENNLEVCGWRVFLFLLENLWKLSDCNSEVCSSAVFSCRDWVWAANIRAFRKIIYWWWLIKWLLRSQRMARMNLDAQQSDIVTVESCTGKSLSNMTQMHPHIYHAHSFG